MDEIHEAEIQSVSSLTARLMRKRKQTHLFGIWVAA